MTVDLASAAVDAQAQEEEWPSCFGVPATIVGTDVDDNIINGPPQADVIVGVGGTDVINGHAGRDRTCGGPNPEPTPEVIAEALDGGRGDDRLYGGDGSDDIYGDDSSGLLPWGKGVFDDDILKGGAGFDTLVDYRSGDVDKLYGGSTGDRLYASDGDYLGFLDAGAQGYSHFDEPDRRGDFCSLFETLKEQLLPSAALTS